MWLVVLAPLKPPIISYPLRSKTTVTLDGITICVATFISLPSTTLPSLPKAVVKSASVDT